MKINLSHEKSHGNDASSNFQLRAYQRGMVSCLLAGDTSSKFQLRAYQKKEWLRAYLLMTPTATSSCELIKKGVVEPYAAALSMAACLDVDDGP